MYNIHAVIIAIEMAELVLLVKSHSLLAWSSRMVVSMAIIVVIISLGKKIPGIHSYSWYSEHEPFMDRSHSLIKKASAAFYACM